MTEKLLIELKKWRLNKARSLKLPAYFVFNDATLKSIAKIKPTNDRDLLEVTGIGKSKLDEYGEEIIAIVRNITNKIPQTITQKEEKEGLIEIISRKLNKIYPQYTIMYEEIPVSTRIFKKKVIPKAFSYDRSGYETDEVTVNEKKYKLFLMINNEKKLLISGTQKIVVDYCNRMLVLINKAESGFPQELNDLLEKDNFETKHKDNKELSTTINRLDDLNRTERYFTSTLLGGLLLYNELDGTRQFLNWLGKIKQFKFSQVYSKGYMKWLESKELPIILKLLRN